MAMRDTVGWLILMAFALSACASAETAFQPAAVIILSPNVPGQVSPEYLEAARAVVQRRLDAVLAAKTRVTSDGRNVKIELSKSGDVTLAGSLAKETGIVEFWGSSAPLDVGSKTPRDLVLVMNGLDISQARAERDPSGGKWQVVVKFTAAGAGKMTQFTSANVRRFLVISRDGEVVAALLIQAPIRGDMAVIASALTESEAKSFAAVLNSGALPVPLTIVSVK